MSLFQEFSRMQRQMDRMMGEMERQMAYGLWPDETMFNAPSQPLLGAGTHDTAGKRADIQDEKQQLATRGGQQGSQQLATRGGSTDTSLAPWSGGFGAFPLAPRVDLIAKDNAYTLSADLPGLSKENVKVDLDADRGVVTLSGQQESTNESRDSEWVRRERSSGSFTRSIRLPNDVDMSRIDQVQARMDHGVLHMDIPRTKKENRTPAQRNRQIQIQ